MKRLSIYILFFLGFSVGLKAQINRDSVFLKQMDMFKNYLQLNPSQFNDFKTAHVKFLEKASLLNEQNLDTVTIRQKFSMLKKEIRDALKAALTDDQFAQYKVKVRQSIQDFKKDAAKNKISVTTVDAETDLE